jgi:CPA2 family monovalent cation:H+ antiporter-2
VEQSALPYLLEALLFLALSGILIPLLQRMQVSQVLGFLAAGALFAPVRDRAVGRLVPMAFHCYVHAGRMHCRASRAGRAVPHVQNRAVAVPGTAAGRHYCVFAAGIGQVCFCTTSSAV